MTNLKENEKNKILKKNPEEPEDLYTYVDNICLEDMFVSYKGLKIDPSYSAMQELFKESKTLIDVLEILEFGSDAPRKRKNNTLEKWLGKGNKTYNAVIIKSYDELNRSEHWVLVHFGKFTRRKK